MSELNPTNPCFGCGGANPRGMRLVFERDEERKRILGRFRLGAEYQSSLGWIHGGVIATVLDEAMGKVSRFSGVVAVTAELKVEFHRPIGVAEEITVEAFQVRRNGRELHHQGEIRNAAGQLLAKGRGRFVVVDPEKYESRREKADSSLRSE